jgi:hypothetical protein
VYYYVIPSISILKSDIHYNGYRKSECIKGCGNDYYYKLIFDENSNNPKVSKYAFSISREKEDIGCNWTIYIRYHKDMYAFLNLLDNVLGYKRCKNIIEGSKEFFIGSDRVYMYPFCCRLVKNHEIAEFERKHKNITYF